MSSSEDSNKPENKEHTQVEATSLHMDMEELRGAVPAEDEATANKPGNKQATSSSMDMKELHDALPTEDEATANKPATSLAMDMKELRGAVTAEDEATANKQATTPSMDMKELHDALPTEDEATANKPVLEEVTFDGIVKYILSGNCTNIVTMAGAGISTSAGIPDFRSPGSGLYDNLQTYDLPSPQAIFEIEYFKKNPKPFFMLSKKLWPGTFKPTICHYFIRLLHMKGLLLRHFTQNIDTLERLSGLPSDKIVEAHGTFHTSHCIKCRKEFSQEWIKEEIFSENIPSCNKEECGGLVKPDIVFFGEALPDLFRERVQKDLPKCDLLIIMGTSLVVHPFASLIDMVNDVCPRLYINLECAKPPQEDNFMAFLLGMSGSSFRFDCDDNYRDVFKQGTCDDVCKLMADKLGWGDDLRKLVEHEHSKVDKHDEILMKKNSEDVQTKQQGKLPKPGEKVTAENKKKVVQNKKEESCTEDVTLEP